MPLEPFIRGASSSADLAAIRALFEEYVAWLGVDLAYQGFDDELANLPGCYAPPGGRLLLALDGDVPIGCVGMRPFGDGMCEMKRLYVRSQYQGHGIGRALADRVITEARHAGYTTMVLDTLPHMTGAIRLYESLGFKRRPAYYDTPLAETVFFERVL
jgi:putative acetyltransferase